MPINLNDYSPRQLATLIKQARQRKNKLAKRKPAAGVRRQILSIAKKAGYSLDELFGKGSARRAASAGAAVKKRSSSLAGKKIPPKYRNPANKSQTWAARGQKPKWLVAELAKGRKLADFAIKK